MTVLVLTCYCALQATGALEASDSGRASLTTRGPGRAALGWSLAAGALVAALAAIRTIGVVFACVLVVWLLSAAGLGWRRRLGTAVPAALLCAALLFAYAFAQQGQTGAFGLSRFSGWPLYSRVATFADCRRFTSPPGTAGLCQSIPSSRRPGPSAYIWTSQSPAVRLFGLPPSGGGKLAAFARAAILAQPGDYLFVVGRDFVRYIDPAIVPGPWWGSDEQTLALDRRSPSSEALNLPAVRAYFHPFQPVRLRRGIAGALESWRGIVRIHGWMIGLGILLAISGMILAPDRATRSGLALLLFGGLALMVGSVAVNVYGFRYGIPPGVLLIIAGARGAEVLTLRLPSALQISNRRRTQNVTDQS